MFTVTLYVPAVEIYAAGIAAVSCVVLTKVVVGVFPLKMTLELLTNPVPFTVNVNSGPPATVLVGDSAVIAGAGLFTPRTTELAL